MTLQKGIVTALATGTLFLGSLAPMALADTTVSGNGAVSDNSVTLNNNSSTTVTQNNTANITNTVDTSASTGGNHADFNTGGNTGISTGDASNTTNITTHANANVADFNGCNCQNGAGNTSITNNGAFSENKVTTDNNNNTTSLSQNNNAQIRNDVTGKANTGNNTGNFNTGGDTTILTGNASSNTSIRNNANVNIASLGDAGNGNSFGSAVIAGNGAESDNQITLHNGNATTLTQNNTAHITNDVMTGANTGHNHADFNTGGNVLLATGNASNNVAIDNKANLNVADLSACGCTRGENSNISLKGNGAFSENTVTDNFGNILAASQHNEANVTNNVGHSLWSPWEWGSGNGNNTGDNTMSWDTNHNGGTSALFTGGTNNTTTLGTSANINSAGNGVGMNWGGMDISLLFDMNSLLNQLHV